MEIAKRSVVIDRLDRNVLSNFCHRLYVMPGHVSEAHCRHDSRFHPFLPTPHLPAPRRRVTFINDPQPSNREERERERDARLSGHALPPSPTTSFQPVHYATRVLVRARVLPGKTRDQRVSKVGAKPSTRKHFLPEQDRRWTPLKVRLV